MKKAVTTATHATEFKTHLEQALSRVFASAPEKSPLSQSNGAERELIILITTNKGLCGSLNINLLRFITKTYGAKNCDFIAIGKKGAQFIAATKQPLLADYSDGTPLDEVGPLISQVVNLFLEGKYHKVSIAYNQFISSLKNTPVVKTILPFSPKLVEAVDTKEYIVEPKLETIQDALMVNYLEEILRYSILSNIACEHSARMIAMKNATDNATDLIYNLTLVRNQVRQEKITSELLDLVTASTSVEAKAR